MKLVSTIANFAKQQGLEAKNELFDLKNMPSHFRMAYSITKRCRSINDLGIFGSIFAAGKSFTKYGIKPHLPGVLSGIGLVLPLPLTQVAGYGLGKVLQRLI